MAQNILFGEHMGDASGEDLRTVHPLGWRSGHQFPDILEETREARDPSIPSPGVSHSQHATQLQGWGAPCFALMLSILLLRKGAGVIY